MKRLLLFSWTFILFGILSYILWINIQHKKSAKSNSIYFVKSNIFDNNTFKEVLGANEYVLLTVGAQDCGLCDVILSNKKLQRYPIACYYICKDIDNHNLLIAQTLRTRGFPTSYVIDKNGNVIGDIQGLTDFIKQLTNITDHRTDGDQKLHDTNTLEMLNYSFRTLKVYLDDNYDETYYNAMKSKEYGDYFFNNYLIQLCHQHAGVQDSVDYYKNAALRSLEGADYSIFESLICEIDPDNEALAMIHSSNRVHDHNCNHH